MNEFDIEILEDGSIKMDTGPFSAPVHAKAEGLVRAITLAMGGTIKRIRKTLSGVGQRHQEHDHANLN